MSSPGEQHPHGENRPGEAAAQTPERFTDNAEYVAVIQNALDRYGEPFLAWLMLDGVDQVDRRVVEKFEANYAGWYPTRRDLMNAQVENLGWVDALEAFRKERGIPTGALALDWDEIYDHCLEVYAVEERLGGIHVFIR